MINKFNLNLLKINIKNSKLILCLILIIIFSNLSLYSKDNILIKSLKNELNRTMQSLKSETNPPYFISYYVTDIEKVVVSASFGSITSSNSTRNRLLDIDLRVGDYKFDNTHIIRGNSFSFGGGLGAIELPLEDDEKIIRNAIWLASDKIYKSASERYEKAITNQKIKIKEEDESNDNSIEKPIISHLTINKPTIIRSDWEQKVKDLSKLFLADKDLYDGDVIFQFEFAHKTIVNSEGTEISWDDTFSRVFVYAKTKSEDGMSLPLYESYFSYSPEGLPSFQDIEKDIKIIISDLNKLRIAPLMNTYSGPAILSGEASGVFFHEIFGHRVEGHREKDPNSGQTFKKSVNTSILPNFIDVIFDPTLKNYKGKEVSGYYDFDDEGVKSQRVVSVDKGIFKSFLMNRSPIESFPNSNGHGRKQFGYKSVSRQSNLIIESSKVTTFDSLKLNLKRLCKEKNLEFGLFFDVVQGGFTFTNRTIPNAFNVQPLIVYKIFVDGRPDELVKGVDLIGTPLSTFANIIAASNDLGVFNGICGAESGGVPVSASSPSILVSNIEVQKKKKSQAKLPILQNPLKSNQ